MLRGRELRQRIGRRDKRCGRNGCEQPRKFFHDAPLLSGNSKVKICVQHAHLAGRVLEHGATVRGRAPLVLKPTLNVLNSRAGAWKRVPVGAMLSTADQRGSTMLGQYRFG